MNIRVSLSRSAYGRGVLSGIFAAAPDFPECRLWMRNPNFPQEFPKSFDGAICGIWPKSMRRRSWNMPVVNTLSMVVENTWQVCTNARAVCEMAFNHLYERQIRQFCYLDYVDGPPEESRMAAFGVLAGEAGCRCSRIGIVDQWAYLEGRFSIADTIGTLPLPVGIMVPRDRYAPPVFKACRQLGLSIPDDVTVISLNNSVPICTTTEPHLTSIEQNTEQIGSLALDLVVRLIRGENVSKHPVFVEPKQLVTRGSTDHKHRRDMNVTRAIDFMTANIAEPIVLEDLLREQSLTQRVFERRFKEETGLPPMRYLRHLRLDRAKRLLETTYLEVSDVAKQCGISSSNHLCALFRQHFNQSPLAYRKGESNKG